MQLVINSPGTYLSQKDKCFRLKQDEKKMDVSPVKVESILITNKALISTQAVAMALENNIDLIFLDSFGDPVGRVWFSKMGSTTLIRRKQLQALQSGLGMELAIEMVQKKLENQVRFLKKLMYSRPGKEEVFAGPLGIIEQADSALRTLAPGRQDVAGSIMGTDCIPQIPLNCPVIDI